MGYLFLTMFLLIFLGVPVAFAIGLSSIGFLAITNIKPLILIAQRMVTGLDSFPLLAIPLFILVGNLMASGGISKRLVNWAESLVGSRSGGLGIVAILSCVVFAAISGSAPATVAAIGTIIIPSMVQKGYTKETAGGLVAAAGALGPIIPPSIPMIIYGVTMNISVTDMFLGGVLPGVFIALLLIMVNMVIAKRSPAIIEHSSENEFSWINVLKSTWSGLGALFLPVLILGGIYGGIFTPTEAAAVGVLYSLIVGFVVYRELKLKDLPTILIKSMETSAMICFIVAVANVLSWLMSTTQVSNSIVSFLMQYVNSPIVYLLMLNFFLLLVGALLDNIAAIIIMAPIVIPLGLQLGLDPLHLGVLFVINIVVGFVTPPFGYNLFTACAITGLKFDRIVKGVWPFLIVQMIAVLIFAFVPQFITFLPNLIK
ncbi:MAG: TRAP transporter large permease subunit [Bacillota bacterium]